MNRFATRKNVRLKEYDYSQEGYYFITICTKNRKCILSTVGAVAYGRPETVILTPIGKITEKYILNCQEKYKGIYIDEYIIMPNHVHLIININGQPWASAPTISTIVSTLKTLVTKEINHSIWQRNFYEHIIRNEKEYLKIKEYIMNNPTKWKEDKYFKDIVN